MTRSTTLTSASRALAGAATAPRAATALLVLATAACGAPRPSPDVESLDTGPRDTSAPPIDTGTRVDTGTPLPDTGTVPPDADATVTPPDVTLPDVTMPPPDSATTDMPFVYVGSGNGQISLYAMDPMTAALTPRGGGLMPGGNPSFLATDPRARYLYSVNEGAGGVLAYAIDPRTAALTPLNQVMSEGAGPAHVAVDPTGGWVFAANYGGGSIAVWPIGTDGRIGARSDRETPGTNPHQIVIDASGRYVYVPCLGSDYVAQFLFDPGTGQLRANTPAQVMTATRAGPRHMAMHPTGRYAYLINELNSTMTALTVNTANGTLAPVQTLSTLPAGFSGANTTAEVQVGPGGRFLYGSNRGHNSIVIYAINPASGMLTLVGHQPTGGNTPRHFSIDPTGAFLLAANQDSNNVVAFRIDAAVGTLTRLGTTPVPNRPAYAGAVQVPGR